MFYADRCGLKAVLTPIRDLQANGPHGELWEPAPLLVEPAESARALDSLNGRQGTSAPSRAAG